MNATSNSMWMDILLFRKMVTTSVVKVLYVVVAVLITLLGLSQVLTQFPLALSTIIFGNLFWRITCESLIVAFGIHQELMKVSQKLG
jgi:Domain of unknown function (DUF4282)